MKIVSWNIAHRHEPWLWLLGMDADIALLQEAGEPPAAVTGHIETDGAPWLTDGADVYRPRRWRTAVVKLSERVAVEWIEAKAIVAAGPGELALSRPGTLAAATVTAPGSEPLVIVSMYAPWESPHAATGSGWIISDASAHRVVSDLSAFIGSERNHRILAAGDLNILHGHGEGGNAYWAGRYGTVFTRLDALGLQFVGPQAPHGRQADPWPDELPPDSRNVPTFHSSYQTPATATRQLDYVFASASMADVVHVRALNEVEQWGPSDHCRLEIDLP
ncbi:MAG: hypothetical protein OXU67_03540 [Chloroflexota bacterium]|nr:hypothetical protein [Chloroflexota bacterium]